MTAVVVRIDDITRVDEGMRDWTIPQSVFAHAVRDLNDPRAGTEPFHW